MFVGLLCLLGLTPALAFQGSEGAPRWSADGRWIAFTISRPVQGLMPEPGWIFETANPGTPLPTRGGPDDPVKTGLYVAGTGREDVWLIEESNGLLTDPEWSPDGRALAYGRIRHGDQPGSDRYEVVINESPGAGRILDTRPLASLGAGGTKAIDSTSRLTIAWSPDSHYLAVSVPDSPPRTLVLRADNGRVLKVVPDAYWPSWAPGSMRLVLVRGTDKQTLLVTEAGPGAVDTLANIGRLFQPVDWSKDGKAIVCLARRVVEGPKQATATIDFLRLSSKTGGIENAVQLGFDSPKQGRVLRILSYSVDRDLSELFYTLDQTNDPPTVVRFFPKTSETLSRFHPLDSSLSIRSISHSPKDHLLAVRLGSSPGVIGLWDYSKGSIAPFVPDDEARIAWLSLLVNTSRKLLGACLPPVGVLGKPVARPTLLPIPGELPANHEMVFRLKRLARVARPLCDRRPDSAPGGLRLQRFLLEARLHFDVLVEDFSAALITLERLEAEELTPPQRLALLGVRAQIMLGLSDWDRAKEPIDYLLREDARAVSRYEVTPGGVTLTLEPKPSQGWGRYLAQRTADLTRVRRDLSQFVKPDVPMMGAGRFVPRQAMMRPFEDPRLRIPPPPDNPIRVPFEIPIPRDGGRPVLRRLPN